MSNVSVPISPQDFLSNILLDISKFIPKTNFTKVELLKSDEENVARIIITSLYIRRIALELDNFVSNKYEFFWADDKFIAQLSIGGAVKKVYIYLYLIG